MNKDSKSKKVLLLLILVLTISIGYAAIASTLKINGNTTVKGLNWSIYWDNVVPTEGSVTGANVVTAPTTSGTTTTTIDFSVILPEPGDFYEFEVDAVNAGTIDAMIADEGIIKKAYSDANYTNEVTLPDVVRYTVTYQDGTAVEPNHLLAKKDGNTPTRERYKVRVEYRNDDEIDPDDLDGTNDRQYYLRFQVEYVQADSSAIDLHPAPVNPYLTRFDGNYIAYRWLDEDTNGYTVADVSYHGDAEWYTSLNPNSIQYLRTDGTTPEACGIFESGTVCLTSSYYLSEYSDAGNFEADFEDVANWTSWDITTVAELEATGLKGYSLEKAKEMLTKGAIECMVTNEAACEISTYEVCSISANGNVSCVNEGGDDIYIYEDGNTN